MKKEIKSVLPQVIHLYLSASGPLFLFKSLRELNPIKILASKYSPEQLMDFYSKKAAGVSINELCLYYIILVALSFKTYGEASQYLQSLGKENYIWAEELAELALSSFKGFQVEPVFLEKKPVIKTQSNSLGKAVTDSTTNIRFEGKFNEN